MKNVEMPRLLKEMSPARSGWRPSAPSPVKSRIASLANSSDLRHPVDVLEDVGVAAAGRVAVDVADAVPLEIERERVGEPGRARRSGRASGPTTRRSGPCGSACRGARRARAPARAASRRRSRCRRCRRATSRGGRARARIAPARPCPSSSATSTGILRQPCSCSGDEGGVDSVRLELLDQPGSVGVRDRDDGDRGLPAPRSSGRASPRSTCRCPRGSARPARCRRRRAAPRSSRSATLPGIGKPSVTTNLPATSPDAVRAGEDVVDVLREAGRLVDDRRRLALRPGRARHARRLGAVVD